jgi:hypothetical protein
LRGRNRPAWSEGRRAPSPVTVGRVNAGDHFLFSIMTTVANAMMQPVRPTAMPALVLQHPPPERLLSIVTTGVRMDAMPDALLTS